MRIPSYRAHASGQARVTLNGKDYLLGSYGSPQSKEAYGRLIAEYSASGASHSFGTPQNELKIEESSAQEPRQGSTISVPCS